MSTLFLGNREKPEIFGKKEVKESHLHLYLVPDHSKLTISADFSILKASFTVKNNIEATELWQRPKFYIFQEALFCILASNKYFKTSSNCSKAIFMKRFYSFNTNWSFLGFPCIFKEVRSRSKLFRQSWKKYFNNLLPEFITRKWMYELPRKLLNDLRLGILWK